MAEQSSVPPAATSGVLKQVVKVLFSALVLAWVLHKPQTRAAFNQLNSATMLATGVALVGFCGCQLVNTWKWCLLLDATGHRVPYWELARLTFIGMFANFFLPTSIGGDVARIGLVSSYGVPLATGALTVFLQRFTGFVAMLGIALAGVAAAAAQGAQAPTQVLGLAAGVTVAGLLALAAGAVAEQRWQLGARLPAKLGGAVHQLGEGVRQLAAAPRTLGWVMLLSLGFQLGTVVLQAYLGRAVGVTCATVHWFWVVPMLSLGEMVPLSLAGLGTREVAAQGLFRQLGDADQAVVASTLWQVQKILAGLPGGVLWWAHGRAARRERP